MKYSTLNSIQLFDEDGNAIKTQLNAATAPIVDNNAIQIVDLLEPGKSAVRYEIEMIDQKTNKITKSVGEVKHTDNQSVCSIAVREEFKKIKEQVEIEKDALTDDCLAKKLSNDEYDAAVKEMQEKWN